MICSSLGDFPSPRPIFLFFFGYLLSSFGSVGLLRSQGAVGHAPLWSGCVLEYGDSAARSTAALG